MWIATSARDPASSLSLNATTASAAGLSRGKAGAWVRWCVAAPADATQPSIRRSAPTAIRRPPCHVRWSLGHPTGAAVELGTSMSVLMRSTCPPSARLVPITRTCRAGEKQKHIARNACSRRRGSRRGLFVSTLRLLSEGMAHASRLPQTPDNEIRWVRVSDSSAPRSAV